MLREKMLRGTVVAGLSVVIAGPSAAMGWPECLNSGSDIAMVMHVDVDSVQSTFDKNILREIEQCVYRVKLGREGAPARVLGGIFVDESDKFGMLASGQMNAIVLDYTPNEEVIAIINTRATTPDGATEAQNLVRAGLFEDHPAVSELRRVSTLGGLPHTEEGARASGHDRAADFQDRFVAASMSTPMLSHMVRINCDR